jgi:adenylate cyclase
VASGGGRIEQVDCRGRLLTQPVEIQRKLAAIFAADVEGFTRLTAADEDGTLKILTNQRAILDGLIGRHRGRIANTAGDSVLAEFPSVTDAVRCAAEAQAAMTEAAAALAPERRVLFRIGIHLGDVVTQGADLMGTGVNIAARLQALAPAGGIVISAAAHDQVRKTLALAYSDLGEQHVKNLDEPVRAFAVGNESVVAPGAIAATAPSDPGKPLPLPDKPSIAVLPFQNMSGDPEQEYFADGMVEDIITALSRFKSLFVIARNSSFTYKGKSPDIRQVGRELGVRYVLEGSVRKSGNRVRITGQLVEAANGAHLWADKFDGALEDVFDLQDKITANVVAAIIPKLDEAEMAALKRKPPESWKAYDHYLRGKELLATQKGLSATTEAEQQLGKAIALDPEFAPAYAWAAYSKFRRRGAGVTLTEAEVSEADRLAARAVELSGDDGEVLALVARVFADVTDRTERGGALADRAVSINPNVSGAWYVKGWTSIYRNELEKASDAFDRTMRLNPFDGEMVWAGMFGKSWSCRFMGRTDEALTWAERMTAQRPDNLTTLISLEESNFRCGRVIEAKAVVDLIHAAHPNLRASWMRQQYRRRFTAEHLTIIDQMIDRLGLPE